MKNGRQDNRVEPQSAEVAPMATVAAFIAGQPDEPMDPDLSDRVLRWSADVLPVCFFKIDRHWQVAIRPGYRLSLSRLSSLDANSPALGWRRCRQLARCLVRLQDFLLQPATGHLHPELIHFASTDPDAQATVPCLPAEATAQLQVPASDELHPDDTLINWFAKRYNWPDEQAAETAALYQNQDWQDLAQYCDDRLTACPTCQTGQQAAFLSSTTASCKGKSIMDKSSQKQPPATKRKENLLNKAKSLWQLVWNWSGRDLMDTADDLELDLTAQLNDPDGSFRLALLSEGLPGTPAEEEGVRAYILVEEFIIGRDRMLCDLVLDSPAVGRRHARIIRHASTFFVEDLGSKNKTLLNGKRLNKHEETLLPDRCRLQFADRAFHFHAE